jgi:RNA-binding protein YlmH
LDVLVSAVFSLSRGEGNELVEKEKVSLAGKLCTDASREAKAGERISVRGFGRFYYDGICGETRKGKSRVRVRKYI